MILVNISEIPWSAERRRNSAIFLELLARPGYEEGIFVGPASFLGRRPLQLRARAAAIKSSLALREVAPRVHYLSPTYAIPRGAGAEAAAMVWRIRRRIAGRPYCLWVNCIDLGSYEIARRLRRGAARVVVDLSDDWSAFEARDPAARDARLADTLSWADAVIAVNEHVAAKFPHPRSRVFKNGTDFTNFQRFDPAYRLGDVLPRRPGRKIVGFHGGLNTGRVDEVLLEALLDAIPDATFLFVGYSNDPALVARLTARPNVVIHPAVPFTELPHVLKSFDVAIVPHAVNEHTRGNDLLKVNDYLASGVPIVSTDCSNVRRHGAAVQVADTHADFIARVRAVLAGAPHDPAPGLALAAAASWERTVPPLADWLDEVCPH